MRSVSLISLAAFGFFAAAAHGQINPATQIRWPACAGPNQVYSITSNTCIAAGTAANPAGSTGQTQFNAGGIFGAWTQSQAFANIVAPGGALTGPVTSSSTISALNVPLTVTTYAPGLCTGSDDTTALTAIFNAYPVVRFPSGVTCHASSTVIGSGQATRKIIFDDPTAVLAQVCTGSPATLLTLNAAVEIEGKGTILGCHNTSHVAASGPDDSSVGVQINGAYPSGLDNVLITGFGSVGLYMAPGSLYTHSNPTVPKPTVSNSYVGLYIPNVAEYLTMGGQAFGNRYGIIKMGANTKLINPSANGNGDGIDLIGGMGQISFSSYGSSGAMTAATYYLVCSGVDVFGNVVGTGPEISFAVDGTTQKSVSLSCLTTPLIATYNFWIGTAPATETSFFSSNVNTITISASAGTAGTPPVVNEGHGSIVGGSFNHNSYALYCQSNQNDSVANSAFALGNFFLNNCSGMAFNGNIFDAINTFAFEGGGPNVISGGTYFGTAPSFSHNYLGVTDYTTFRDVCYSTGTGACSSYIDGNNSMVANGITTNQIPYSVAGVLYAGNAYLNYYPLLGEVSVSQPAGGTDFTPIMTANNLPNTTTPAITLTSNKGVFSSSFDLYKAFDQNAATDYASNTSPGGGAGSIYIDIALSQAVALTSYSLETSANLSLLNRMGITWTLKADNAACATLATTLDTQTTVAWASASQIQTFTVANTTAYSCYQLNFTANGGGTLLQIAEIGLFSNQSPAINLNGRSLDTAVTFNNGGSGAASGTTYNGSASRTVSYNTLGAAASNAATTVNGQTCTLGSTCTVTTAPSPQAFAALSVSACATTLATAGAGISNATLAAAHTCTPTTVNVSGLVNGDFFNVKVSQDGTGGGTVTLGTGCTWLIGSAGAGYVASTSPSLTSAANGVNMLTAQYDGTNCLVTVE